VRIKLRLYLTRGMCCVSLALLRSETSSCAFEYEYYTHCRRYILFSIDSNYVLILGNCNIGMCANGRNHETHPV
jgi:hypothetical protein